MDGKYGVKTRREKKPKQVFWELSTEKDFTELVKDYDPELDVSTAIIKLIKHAIQDWYLPGYIKKERKKPVNNEMTDKLNRLSKNG